MPKVAVQTGVVDAVVPLKEITKEIMKIVGVHIIMDMSQYLEIFIEESKEHLQGLNQCLLAVGAKS